MTDPAAARPIAMELAADFARTQVAEVRDSPAGRRALALRTYGGPTGEAPDHLPFRRAHLAFIDWQLRRGVLEPLDAALPGSRWWRSVNERLLRDGCEAVARAGGRGGPMSSASIPMWMDFVAEPTANTWYRAHNSSIVGGYLEGLDLAGLENETERFFMNVVLVRVLYAHAMNSNPRLALGWMRFLAPLLGDPRIRMTGLFLSVNRVLPDVYPLDADIPASMRQENGIGRLLDYGVIAPRMQAVYDWSADALGEPRLRSLIAFEGPCYALGPRADAWYPRAQPRLVRTVKKVLPPPTP